MSVILNHDSGSEPFRHSRPSPSTDGFGRVILACVSPVVARRAKSGLESHTKFYILNTKY